MSKKETSPYDYQLQETGEVREVTVSRIAEDTAANVYKSKAKKPEATVILLYTKDLYPPKETKIGAITKPDKKVLVPKHNMYRYIRNYGPLRIGGKVKVMSDESGFWRLVL